MRRFESPFISRVDLPASKPENTTQPLPRPKPVERELGDNNLPPLEKCCEASCWARWKDHEPCYGKVQVISEASEEYIHGCEGHPEYKGKYKPFVPAGAVEVP